MNVSWPLFLLNIGGLLFAIILVLFWPTTAFRTKAGTPAVIRKDDRYWYGRGCLYNNPDDPAVFVPKRYSSGLTVNFGHHVGKLIMIAMLLILVLTLLKALSQH